MAPEILTLRKKKLNGLPINKNESFDAKKADIFSLGVVLGAIIFR